MFWIYIDSDQISLEQVHFHWGENNTVGSEHKVDSTPFLKYCMENKIHDTV